MTDRLGDKTSPVCSGRPISREPWWRYAETAPAPPLRFARLATARARRLGRAVMRTLDPLPLDSRCLVRSLVLTTLLARRGVAWTIECWLRHQADPSSTERLAERWSESAAAV